MSSDNTNINVPATTDQPPVEQLPAIRAQGQLAYLFDKAVFDQTWRVAKAYALSSFVPKDYQGNQNNCFISVQLAIRLGVEPLMLMQHLAIVHGRPSIDAQLAISLLNNSGKIRGTLKYRHDGTGDAYGCTAWAIDAATGEKVEGPKVDWAMVKAEGWNKDKQLRDGKGVQKSKWNTLPSLMFCYRAASYFIRTLYPEVVMGLPTREEMEDVIDVESRPALPAASPLNAALGLDDDAQDADVTPVIVPGLQDDGGPYGEDERATDADVGDQGPSPADELLDAIHIRLNEAATPEAVVAIRGDVANDVLLKQPENAQVRQQVLDWCAKREQQLMPPKKGKGQRSMLDDGGGSATASGY